MPIVAESLYYDFLYYGGLFLNAFVAATLLPAFSEASFAALLAGGKGQALFLFFSAASGNVLGACVNYWLGSKISTYGTRRWFPFSENQIERAKVQFERYGKWSLLFSWLPIIGDPLTFIAGALRTRFRHFIVLVTLGKATRYAIIWFGVSHI